MNEAQKRQDKKSSKMAAVFSTISMTKNMNGLNNLIKRYTLSMWIKKQDPTHAVCKKTHQIKKYQQVESKSKKKSLYYVNHKKAGVPVHILDKQTLKQKVLVEMRDIL